MWRAICISGCNRATLLSAGYFDPSSLVAQIKGSSCVNATFDMTDLFVNVTCNWATVLGAGYIDPSSHVAHIHESSCVNATFDVTDVFVNVTCNRAALLGVGDVWDTQSIPHPIMRLWPLESCQANIYIINESSYVNATFDVTHVFVNVSRIWATLSGAGYFDRSSHGTQINGSLWVNATFDVSDVL